MAANASILIVEDEPLIAMMLEDFVRSLGHDVVATCDCIGEALRRVAPGGIDLAILDVNLKGESVWPVAAALKAKDVPFIFASGGFVDGPPAEFAATPTIEKPYTIDRVATMIDRVLTGAIA